jgi:hypothetical protein
MFYSTLMQQNFKDINSGHMPRLSSQIGLLTALTKLHIDVGVTTAPFGQLPTELGNLNRLTSLDLAGAPFFGSLLLAVSLFWLCFSHNISCIID